MTKRYPGQDQAAVDNVTLEIPAGEIVMLVGPSGCGKTTTMKMINRLIEPTSGRIFIGDEDVTDQNPDELRRHIGYVIQGAGLFPHYSVGQNIALVPRLLGWEKERTGHASTSCSTSSVSSPTSSGTATPASSPVVSSSASGLRGPSPPTRPCC